MLTLKILCCASVLAFMLMLGWKLEQFVISPKPGKQEINVQADHSLLKSVDFAEPIPASVPFLSREYVRVRLKSE